MSEHYKEFYSETLYGLFEMIIVKNLFLTNNKMTIKQLLDIIKDKIKNSSTNDDKLTIVIYTINHFINENKYNDIKSLLFNDNSFVDYILTDKITITKIICNFDKEKIYNHNIQDIVRQIIYKIVILKNYNFVNDIKLLSFLYRSYTTLKLNRKIYKSLQEIDECISSNKWL
jgi:hypothetical protein